MKKIQIILITLFSGLTATGQDSLSTRFENKNSIQLEAGGPGGLYSINYERILINKDFWKFATQAGFTYIPSPQVIGLIILPVGVNAFGTKGNGNNHLDIGLGMSFVFEKYKYYDIYDGHFEGWIIDKYYYLRFGYRFQKPKGRFVFRVNLIPVAEIDFSDLYLWGAVSGGYAF